MSAFAERALIVTFPPGPQLRGTPSWKIGTCVRRLRTQGLAFSLPPAHGGLSGQKLRSVRAVQTPPTLAKPWQLGKYRCPTDHRRPQQVGRHQAVRNRSSSLQILLAERPCGLRVGRKQVLILPAGVYQKPEVTRPRKMGVQGGDAYEHRRKPGVHRRRPPARL